jgi:regulation of enolase protein 1 (concanavalin A-like superfamily)
MIDFTFGKWIFEPKASQVAKGSVSITTEPETVFWQRYYCGFRNNNEAELQIESEDNY